MKIINAYKAKTTFSALLREVKEKHERYTITLNGEPAATLEPVLSLEHKQLVAQRIKAMRPIKSKINIRNLIDEGRR